MGRVFWVLSYRPWLSRTQLPAAGSRRGGRRAPVISGPFSRPQVNVMIQRSARLRVGAAKAKVVAACRAAVKANNMTDLFRHLSTGGA